MGKAVNTKGGGTMDVGIRVKGEKIFTQPHSVAVWWVVSDAAAAPLENPQVSPPSPPPSPPDAPQPLASPPHQPPPEPTTPPTRSSRCPVCGSLRLPGEAMCLDGGGLCTQVFCDDTLSETDVTEEEPVSPVLLQHSSP